MNSVTWELLDRFLAQQCDAEERAKVLVPRRTLGEITPQLRRDASELVEGNGASGHGACPTTTGDHDVRRLKSRVVGRLMWGNEL